MRVKHDPEIETAPWLGVPLRGTLDLADLRDDLRDLLCADEAIVGRYETNGTVTAVASWSAAGGSPRVGAGHSLGGKNIAALVAQSGRASRIDDYGDATGAIGVIGLEMGYMSAVGVPIMVAGRLWGLIAVGFVEQQPAPADTEKHLNAVATRVAALVATVEDRDTVARLGDEQGALRRIATLVARAVSPEQLFAAVTEEASRLLSVTSIQLARYEPDNTITVLASSGSAALQLAVGTRVPLGGNNPPTLVARTGRRARVDAFSKSSNGLDTLADEHGVTAALGEPIIVNGRLWGVLGAATTSSVPLPANIDDSLASFTQLVSSAVANAEAHRQLVASRARIVTAGDNARRRIGRDLHDGGQQRLVHAVILLKLALRALKQGDPKAAELVADGLQQAERANSDLRELAHGILPAVLTSAGLEAAVQLLALRCPLPVTVDARVGRLPAAIEATAYFVISEALTNVIKHARATHVRVSARVENAMLHVEVSDDGVGGAGTGPLNDLADLTDRVTALNGLLEVDSSTARGTRVHAAVPISSVS